MSRTTWLIAAAGAVCGIVTIALLPERLLFVRHLPQAGQAASAASAASAPLERWVCPMGDFIGTKPGLCPICGMTLQRATAGNLGAEQQRRMGIELSTVEEGPAVVTVRAYGAVRYDDRSAQVVIPRVAGRITKRHPGALHDGTQVAVGEALVDLYSPVVFAAQGELAAAQRLGDRAGTAALVERFARWNLAPVAAAVIAGGEPQDTITIHSPFAGRVVMAEGKGPAEGAESLAIGSEVLADRPLLTLVDPHAFMVVIHVPEPRGRMIREGQPVAIASDDLGELPDVGASVSWVAPGFTPEIRAREIHLHLSDPHDRLLPGSLVAARFKAALAQDLTAADPADPATWGRFPLVPKSAVLSTGVRTVAWRVDGAAVDGQQPFAIAPLALGPRLEDDAGNDRYVVRAGLKAGDRVVTQGLFLIDSQAQLAGSPSLLFPQGAAGAAPAAVMPSAAAPAHVHQH